MFNENISLLQSDTMEWMQGMQQPLLYQLWPVFQNHYYQFIPSTWKWGQSFQHVGRNGKQHDTTTGWVDGHAGHGNAKHGQFILYLVCFYICMYKACFFREGWVVGCQWTIPSYLQCGAACRAGPWGQWGAEEWWRCVLSILKKGMVCLRVNIDHASYVNILLCLVRSAEQSCRCLEKGSCFMSMRCKSEHLYWVSILIRWPQFGMGGSLPGPHRERGEVCWSLKLLPQMSLSPLTILAS